MIFLLKNNITELDWIYICKSNAFYCWNCLHFLMKEGNDVFVFSWYEIICTWRQILVRIEENEITIARDILRLNNNCAP